MRTTDSPLLRAGGWIHCWTAIMDRQRFLWSDAWFVTALGVCPGGRASLARVIGAADAIQHAIMTREEVNGAIGRLCRGGYIARDAGGSLELTDAGRALVAESARGRSLLAQQERIERLLAAEPWTEGLDPRRAGDGEDAQVTEAEYAAAVGGYTSGGVA